MMGFWREARSARAGLSIASGLLCGLPGASSDAAAGPPVDAPAGAVAVAAGAAAGVDVAAGTDAAGGVPEGPDGEVIALAAGMPPAAGVADGDPLPFAGVVAAGAASSGRIDATAKPSVLPRSVAGSDAAKVNDRSIQR